MSQFYKRERSVLLDCISTLNRDSLTYCVATIVKLLLLGDELSTNR